jgi:hypothetical protein
VDRGVLPQLRCRQRLLAERQPRSGLERHRDPPRHDAAERGRAGRRHFDSISRQGIGAPGADDNASGTAAVLECARVLCVARFERTLQFAAFSAEEIGLFGSTAYASNLYNRGDDLVGMINVDMIGYRAGGDRRDLDIISDVGSGWLRDAAFQAAALHVADLPLVDGALPGSASSDHVSFWGLGYSAIAFFEDSQSSSPYIHTSNDTYGTSYNATYGPQRWVFRSPNLAPAARCAIVLSEGDALMSRRSR